MDFKAPLFAHASIISGGALSLLEQYCGHFSEWLQ